jgi:hypothetical protein
MRRPLIVAALLAALLLSACAPVAQYARDLLDTTDGATLSYVQRSTDTLPGLRYDPGDTVALAVVLVARGTDLALLDAPEGVTCTATPSVIDCRLGDVSEPLQVSLTGLQVVASATWRRTGSTQVLQTFAR